MIFLFLFLEKVRLQIYILILLGTLSYVCHLFYFSDIASLFKVEFIKYVLEIIKKHKLDIWI
jgi:hypothetical protein